jgi:hypothetical protein
MRLNPRIPIGRVFSQQRERSGSVEQPVVLAQSRHSRPMVLSIVRQSRSVCVPQSSDGQPRLPAAEFCETCDLLHGHGSCAPGAGSLAFLPPAFTSAPELASALRRAAAAHGEHEKRIGKSDPEGWPDWYAEYVVAERSGKPLPS